MIRRHKFPGLDLYCLDHNGRLGSTWSRWYIWKWSVWSVLTLKIDSRLKSVGQRWRALEGVSNMFSRRWNDAFIVVLPPPQFSGKIEIRSLIVWYISIHPYVLWFVRRASLGSSTEGRYIWQTGGKGGNKNWKHKSDMATYSSTVRISYIYVFRFPFAGRFAFFFFFGGKQFPTAGGPSFRFFELRNT